MLIKCGNNNYVLIEVLESNNRIVLIYIWMS